ncbi:MAG: type V CRISPR-associated protein Cas12b, partial [Limnohabitans sp.]|nr:type V CRISPR-associated protein Cas12b [Limnohabitans sp.]
MARKADNLTNRQGDESPKSDGFERPTTQRAYTLRVRPTLSPDTPRFDATVLAAELQSALWATHASVNAGSRAFGNWLLTLRGGLSHELAEPPASKKGDRSEVDTAKLRKQRRILLALSWLNVEDEHGAPTGTARIATGRDIESVRTERVLAALRQILKLRGIAEAAVKSWESDCADSLMARIREDAVWVNRSECFDRAQESIGSSLTRVEVWDVLGPFFNGEEPYFAGLETDDDSDGTSEEKAKDLVQKAGQWLSSRFGQGKGADFGSMAQVYRAMSDWAQNASEFSSAKLAFESLADALAAFSPSSADAEGILKLISGPGYKSATRNLVKGWETRVGAVSREQLERFREVAREDAAKAAANVGGKGRRPWSDAVLNAVESACGFTYLVEDGAARHSEFAVMLDHAARRVSIGHSWIKRAESERQRFEDRAAKLNAMDAHVLSALDRFVRERSDLSGATAAGGSYRIRPSAIAGWEEVLKHWRRPSCSTISQRVEAVRVVQADPDIVKFGDAQLFETLADDRYSCVWRRGDLVDHTMLAEYVYGHDAREKQRRFKVPAYRHPDPLRHPVFCDFGNSRWDIRYAVHEAAKAQAKAAERLAAKPSAGAAKKSKAHAPDNTEAGESLDTHGLQLTLWDGTTHKKVKLRWSSKRFSRDLGLNEAGGRSNARPVSRADRLGRAAAGVGANFGACAQSLFRQNDWNGRLQAPRLQLNAIAE